jgi:hypothetical protein
MENSFHMGELVFKLSAIMETKCIWGKNFVKIKKKGKFWVFKSKLCSPREDSGKVNGETP